MTDPTFERTIDVDDSKLITAVEYDPGNAILDITFTNGRVYRYNHVGPMVFARLMTAKSIGNAFNQYVKGLDYTEVTDE